MLYKPNFCAECAKKIERDEWRLWTNRRFCEDCEANLEPLTKRLRNIGLSAVAVFLGGAFALYFALPFKPPAPAVVRTNQPANNANAPANRAQPQTLVAANPPAPLPNQPPVAAQTPKTVAPPIAPEIIEQPDAAYYCGAKTQKGTLCSRRVRGGGRCWQHQGKPAMVAQEKLLIRSN